MITLCSARGLLTSPTLKTRMTAPLNYRLPISISRRRMIGTYIVVICQVYNSKPFYRRVGSCLLTTLCMRGYMEETSNTSINYPIPSKTRCIHIIDSLILLFHDSIYATNYTSKFDTFILLTLTHDFVILTILNQLTTDILLNYVIYQFYQCLILMYETELRSK